MIKWSQRYNLIIVVNLINFVIDSRDNWKKFDVREKTRIKWRTERHHLSLINIHNKLISRLIFQQCFFKILSWFEFYFNSIKFVLLTIFFNFDSNHRLFKRLKKFIYNFFVMCVNYRCFNHYEIIISYHDFISFWRHLISIYQMRKQMINEINHFFY
jgi:hypothetical protein